MPRQKKIVYILGAGFSKPCGAPEQKDILSGILNNQHAKSPRLKNFLSTFFGHSGNIPLEDIFTALDRSIAKNEILRRFGIKELLNNNLSAIAIVFHNIYIVIHVGLPYYYISQIAICNN